MSVTENAGPKNYQIGPGSAMHEKRHFWGNVNTWANSDLSAVDILNLIRKAAAAMWPLYDYDFRTNLFILLFFGTVYRAVLVACNLE